MKSKVSPTAIGIFISGAVLILFFSVIIFGSGKLFRKTKPYLLTFQEPVTGLKSGSTVKVMGVDIGEVKEIWLSMNSAEDQELVNVLIELDRRRMASLYKYHPLDLDNRERFSTAVKEKGLRARLNVLSLVSGTLFIDLSLNPSETGGFQLTNDVTSKYWEIPTIPSTKTKMMDSLVASLENLTKFDFGGTSQDLKALLTDVRADLKALQFKKVGEGLVGTIDKANTLLGDPELKAAVSNLNLTLGHMEELSGKLNKDANPLLASAADDLRKAGVALDEAKDMLSALKKQFEPNSTLSRELITTLDQAGQSLEALRELVQQIQRDPSSLITGKPGPTTKP